MDINQQKLVSAFANHFLTGHSYKTIVEARAEAATILDKPVIPGTPEAKLVDECIEQGLVRATQSVIRFLLETSRGIKRTDSERYVEKLF